MTGEQFGKNTEESAHDVIMVLSQHLPVGTEENPQKISGESVSWPRLKWAPPKHKYTMLFLPQPS
jgi:hypothetical protein